MLQKGKFLLLICFFSMISCKKDIETQTNDFKIKDEYINLKFKSYKNIYNSANDSLFKWKSEKLSISKQYFFSSTKLDSVFIFNKDSSCFFTTMDLRKDKNKKSPADFIYAFAGRKINGKWYFFFSGTSMVLPRDGMQDSTYAPFSFEELSYLAYDQEFKPYVKNILEGHPEKNEQRFYTDYSDIQECPKTNKKLDWKCIDSLIESTHHYIYNGKITKEEIAEIQKEMSESVRPPEPIIETKQFWQFWKDEPQIPIFETEEWKTYLKQKYGNKWQENL